MIGYRQCASVCRCVRVTQCLHSVHNVCASVFDSTRSVCVLVRNIQRDRDRGTKLECVCVCVHVCMCLCVAVLCNPD